MANAKISELQETTELELTDSFAVVSGGETKRTAFSSIQKEIVNYLVPTNLTVSAGVDVDLSNAIYNHSEVIKLSWSGSNGNMTLTLPDATHTNSLNRVVRFLSDTTFATNTRVYVTPVAGQTIDGSTNFYEINKEYEGIQLWSDGTEWFIIQKKA